MKHQESNIKLKIIYLTLEMPKEAKIRAAMSYKLHKDYNIIISPEKLRSLFSGYILDDRVLNIIKSDDFQEWLQFIDDHVEFHDRIRNPYGIFNIVKTYAENNGKYTTKEIDWTYDDGTVKKRTVKDKYIANDSNEYVIVMLDHVSLLQPEKGETLHQSISKFSSEYCLHMRDVWNYIPVVVQQQSAHSEQQQFTLRGDTIVDKLKPSADGLAENKLTSRDCDMMIGLFWPHRYNIEEHHNWNLTRIGNYHRELIVLLNRNGSSNLSLDLYMNGASNFFKELPQEPSNKVYNYIEINEQNEI